MYSIYAHLTEQSFRREGETVKQGDVIGYMGCTGNTRPRPCGVHLHFAIVSDTNDGIGYIGCLAFASRNCFDPLGKVIDIKLD
jgi:murein DD-endopeptidase MepM/ murein hydrolase activator NlpD